MFRRSKVDTIPDEAREHQAPISKFVIDEGTAAVIRKYAGEIDTQYELAAAILAEKRHLAYVQGDWFTQIYGVADRCVSPEFAQVVQGYQRICGKHEISEPAISICRSILSDVPEQRWSLDRNPAGLESTVLSATDRRTGMTFSVWTQASRYASCTVGDQEAECFTDAEVKLLAVVIDWTRQWRLDHQKQTARQRLMEIYT